MKVSLLFMVIVSFFWVSACSKELNTKFEHGRVKFSQQKLTIDVEVARTEQQRAVGLMHRKLLAPNKGMLFVFEKKGIQRVWMKDTVIPLDIIFISAQGKIVSLLKALQPCPKSDCKIHNSIYHALYMLELNAGMIEQENIKVGQKLEFSL